MLNAEIDKAFNSFAGAGDGRQRQQALTDLLTHKGIPKYANDPRLEKGVDLWIQISLDGDGGEQQLLGIAELTRLAQVVKAMQPRVRDVMNVVTRHPIPAVSILKDAGDRFNVARSLRLVDQEWVAEYAACSIAAEDLSEKSRSEFMSILFGRTKSLSHALLYLVDAFSGVLIRTESQNESISRRLTRTLIAFREMLVTSRLDAGLDVGKNFEKLIKVSFDRFGMPVDDKVQIDLAREVVLTLHDLVRTRFSVSTEGETYNSLKVCRRMFPGTSWPDGLMKYLELLASDISEALLMLGRQGVANQGLIEQLQLVYGFKERAQSLTALLADDHPELPENIRGWLRRWRFISQIDSSRVLEESLLRSIDSAIGYALIDAAQLAEKVDVAQHIIDCIEIFEGNFLPEAEMYISQAQRLQMAISEIARRREVFLFASVGDMVEFTPKMFDSSGVIVKKRGSVIRPPIVRRDASGVVHEVIVKGVLE